MTAAEHLLRVDPQIQPIIPFSNSLCTAWKYYKDHAWWLPRWSLSHALFNSNHPLSLKPVPALGQVHTTELSPDA